jgi:AraC-like DNA-binding protein
MADPPEPLSDPPKWPTAGPLYEGSCPLDTLSDVLRVLRMTGGVFLDAQFTAPWCVLSHATADDLRHHVSAPGHVIAYHYVVSGQLLLRVDGESPVTVAGGELVLLPHNDAHLLGSALDVPAVDGDQLVPVSDASGLVQIRHGGGGAPTHIVCGFIGLEAARHPLIDALPRVLTYAMAGAPAGDWIASSFRYAAREVASQRAGSGTVLAKLSELLFVEAVRGYAETLPSERKGWLAGLRDPVVSRALTQIHARPAHPWTVDALAAEAFLSRSAFAERFTDLMGMPPMRYLAVWRMQIAAQRLREGHQSISQIALDVGYESEAAFTRAFKREHGVAPGAWRRQSA